MNGNTRLSQALDSHPDVLELIVSLNPHDFQRLHKPVLRKMMAPRITLRRVAQMAGIPEKDLLDRIHRLTGETTSPEASSELEPLPASVTEPPDWLAYVSDDTIRWVDLIPFDDADVDPLPQVVAGWKAMTPGEIIGIRHRWEPQPLYDVWIKIGLLWHSKQVAPDCWHIYVHKPAAESSPRTV